MAKEKLEVVVEDIIQPVKQKMYALEQWAQARQKPSSHLPGMRAFLGERASFKYSLDTWDEIFKAY